MELQDPLAKDDGMRSGESPGDETPEPPADDIVSENGRRPLLVRADAAIRRIPVTVRVALLFSYLFICGPNWGQTNWFLAGWRSLIVLTLLCVAWWSGRRERVDTGRDAAQWKVSPLSGWEPLWALLFLATTLANLDRWPNAGVGLWFIGMTFLIFVIVHDTLSNGRIRLSELSDGLLLGAAGPLVYGVLESLITGTRAAGLTEHPNYYGGMAAWTIPIALARGWQPDVPRRWPYWAVSLVAAVGLTLSGSRGAFLGLIGASAVLLPGRLLIAGAVVAVPVFVAAIAARWGSVLSRLPIYETTVEGILQRPWFGHGLFTFRFREGDYVHLHPHNVVLQIAYDLGLVGLLLAIAQAAWHVRAIARNDAPERRGWIAALVATSLHQLVDVSWMSPGMLVMLPVMLAATTASPSLAPLRAPGRATWIYGALMLAVLGSGWWAGRVDPAFFLMPPTAPPITAPA